MGGSRYGSDFGEISMLPPVTGGSMGGSNMPKRGGVGGSIFTRLIKMRRRREKNRYFAVYQGDFGLKRAAGAKIFGHFAIY